MRACPRCEIIIQDDTAHFCHNCGQSLETAVAREPGMGFLSPISRKVLDSVAKYEEEPDDPPEYYEYVLEDIRGMLEDFYRLGEAGGIDLRWAIDTEVLEKIDDDPEDLTESELDTFVSLVGYVYLLTTVDDITDNETLKAATEIVELLEENIAEGNS